VWLARSDAVWLYLSGSTMALGGCSIEPQRQALAADDDWRAVLQQWLEQHPKKAWRVALGGRLCTLHWLEAIGGTQSIEEAEAAVSAVLSAESTPVQARLAVWSSRGTTPWVAACTPLGLPEQLTVLIGASGRLATLQAWWQMAAHGSNLSSAAMCDDESVTYWRSEGLVVHAAGTMLASPSAQSVLLQRLQVGGSLKSWRLDLDAWGMGREPVKMLEEGADAAAAAV
jgi:hypothetical protein